MSEREGRARVGIRQLRQNLSIYVDRVKDGETLEVTEHGTPVAELRPLSRTSSLYDRLVAEGKITPAHKTLASLPPPLELPDGVEPISETLRRMRDEERY